MLRRKIARGRAALQSIIHGSSKKPLTLALAQWDRVYGDVLVLTINMVFNNAGAGKR
jgi:hypothetical protein